MSAVLVHQNTKGILKMVDFYEYARVATVGQDIFRAWTDKYWYIVYPVTFLIIFILLWITKFMIIDIRNGISGRS